jgi:hypothetical protein
LVWGNTFFVLDLGLDVVDGVGGLDLEGDLQKRRLRVSSQRPKKGAVQTYGLAREGCAKVGNRARELAYGRGDGGRREREDEVEGEAYSLRRFA